MNKHDRLFPVPSECQPYDRWLDERPVVVQSRGSPTYRKFPIHRFRVIQSLPASRCPIKRLSNMVICNFQSVPNPSSERMGRNVMLTIRSQSGVNTLGWPYFFLCFPSPWPHKTGSVGRNKIKKNKNKKVYINVQSRQYAFTCRSIY